jgi:hypothetical protein
MSDFPSDKYHCTLVRLHNQEKIFFAMMISVTFLGINDDVKTET